MSGLTHALDKGMPPRELEGMLDQARDIVDIVKVGWGIGYIDRQLPVRARICREAGVLCCLGGTFLELAARQGRVGEFARWAKRNEITAVEVSNGLAHLRLAQKRRLIRDLSQDFIVLAETGCKDSAVPVVPAQWLGEMRSDLDAGARWVIAEGRESGSAALYEATGAVRTDLVATILDQIPLHRVIFEAPRKQQQVWFVETFGPNVNLGNIPTGEILALETLRLGLRADTAGAVGASRHLAAAGA